jgi:hypothetical protein
MDKKEIVNTLVDAITASGKKFTEIGKDAVFGFLKREGISEKHWEGIYERLKEVYVPKKQKLYQGSVSQAAQVDYSDSSHNNVKVREPRKSIFSEIKKIAG